jgi:hypothetical protein
MYPQTKDFHSVPTWVSALAIHEAERIYEMMPRMKGEKTHALARLEEGIIAHRPPQRRHPADARRFLPKGSCNRESLPASHHRRPAGLCCSCRRTEVAAGSMKVQIREMGNSNCHGARDTSRAGLKCNKRAQNAMTILWEQRESLRPDYSCPESLASVPNFVPSDSLCRLASVDWDHC